MEAAAAPAVRFLCEETLPVSRHKRRDDDQRFMRLLAILAAVSGTLTVLHDVLVVLREVLQH
jgi:hypothetical protein